MRSCEGARGTVGGVAGAFLCLGGAGAGPGLVGTHGGPCLPLGFTADGTTRNVGVSIGVMAGAPCRCAALEEHAGPSVVSLVRSCVSEGPEPVPDGSERMVFRVCLRGSRLTAPRET